MSIEIRQQNGVTIVEPSGRMMGAAASQLREVLTAEIEASDTPRILINFENVNTMDSSGLGSLLQARALANSKEGRIGVVNVAQQISSLIVVTRIVNQFERFESVDEAISELST